MQPVTLKKVIEKYPGGRPQFRKDTGVTEGRLSQLLGGERPSPELAIRIHRITNGELPASKLRPDLWRKPDDVPVDCETAG